MPCIVIKVDTKSKVIKGINILFDSKKQRTTAYHSQGDGQVEKFNSTLLNMLSKHVKRDQKNWNEKLPFVIMAYRCSVNDTTGFTLSMLMFGHELRLPIGVMFDAFELVRENKTTSQRRMKDDYDKKIAGKQIQEGEKVMLFNPSEKPWKTQKLHCPWKKIYEV